MKFIKQTSEILKEKYDSDIPTNAKELMALPGKCVNKCCWTNKGLLFVEVNRIRSDILTIFWSFKIVLLPP